MMGQEVVAGATHSSANLVKVAKSITPAFFQHFCNSIVHVTNDVTVLDGVIWPFIGVDVQPQGLCLRTCVASQVNVFVVLGINANDMRIFTRFYSNVEDVPLEYIHNRATVEHLHTIVNRLAFPSAAQIAQNARNLSWGDYDTFCQRIIKPSIGCVNLKVVHIHSGMEIDIPGSCLSVEIKDGGYVYLVSTTGVRQAIIGMVPWNCIIGTDEPHRMSKENASALAQDVSTILTQFNVVEE